MLEDGSDDEAELQKFRALMCVSKGERRKDPADMTFGLPVLTPHALPLFQENNKQSLKRKREKDRMDPIKSRKPEAPHSGPGKGGRLGEGTFTSFVFRDVHSRDTIRDEDPREAILRHAEAAEKNPMFIAPAYKATQPKPVFDEEEYHEEELPRRQ
eukprot:Colp12_sorted_trinity150504_noHs@9094